MDASPLAPPDVPLAPPSGVRDLLPAEALARRGLADRLLGLFAAHGYELVVTPAFELADVLSRGLGQVDRRELLRFVEPESGEVALFRPDLTPQIARVVATRLRRRPAPWRIAYQGTAIRRRRGRSRRSRQIAQCGVECLGLDPAFADAEITALAARACRAIGLTGARLELGHVGLGREALDAVPEAARGAVAESLARKDVALLEAQLRAAGVAAEARRALERLASLFGGPEVLGRARRLFRSEAAGRALDHIDAVLEALAAEGLDGDVGVDLGDLRGLRYYTGLSFAVLAPGPGEAVLTGGRYDGLLAAFGLPAPATGFAIDLDHVLWALERRGTPRVSARPPRFVFGGDTRGGLDQRLRALGCHVARLPTADRRRCLAFARAWDYDAALVPQRGGRLRAERARDGATMHVDAVADDAAAHLAAWATEARTTPLGADTSGETR